MAIKSRGWSYDRGGFMRVYGGDFCMILAQAFFIFMTSVLIRKAQEFACKQMWVTDVGIVVQTLPHDFFVSGCETSKSRYLHHSIHKGQSFYFVTLVLAFKTDAKLG